MLENMVSPIKLMIAEEEKFQEKALSLYTSDKFPHITKPSYHFCSIGTFLTGKLPGDHRGMCRSHLHSDSQSRSHFIGSEAESNDPLDKISAVKHDLRYLSKATDWWESKCDIHGQVMGNLANKLNKAYAGEVKQTLKAISRSKELESLKLKLEKTKKYVVEKFTKSEEYNHDMVECFNNGFEMFRDYASVISPDYNWSEIDEDGVWQVLNIGGEGMAHHSLVHAARRKAKDMDLLMDL
ncbi:hypothetical protein Prudu_021526 [Prunus dulcis]|uniref:Uncharacterized protein n=1 Tax=Prunus dulcis TaxID=3755 RepID=A0A4Y1RZ76_PRUDU|nr:hypothetical protein Prudu_021526 [Prunus dulcis]